MSTKTQKSMADNDPVLNGRILSARKDTVDFRDKMYIPTLIEVAPIKPLDFYQASDPNILDQGQEGACTGFALAAVANHLLKTRVQSSFEGSVSPRMLYEMAKRHDEWPGEDYAGSSARGAIKGWHKYGVCSDNTWPYIADKEDRELSHTRLQDARNHPLGAYFRVNHKDLVAMHSALSETGILYATAIVHRGWSGVKSNGIIKYNSTPMGGHAFAIVGYDSKGFWIQNSWGGDWGKEGFAHLSYEDWLENGSDVWVARVGVPLMLDSSAAYSSGTFPSSQMGQGATIADLRPHIISLGNDGKPTESGDFGNTTKEIENFLKKDFVRITKNWKKKRILLYAHGGLVSEKSAVQRVAEYRETMLGKEVYPISFVWHSDFWSTLKNILSEVVKRRKSEGLLDGAKDFMLDRLDSTLEPIARSLGGKAAWSEMKENALAATESSQGGAKLVLKVLKRLMASDPDIEIHVAGHSAGSIFMAPVVKELAKFTNINTCTLWAPACTIDLFKNYYFPLTKGAGRAIREFALYTLTDDAEQDDNAGHIYNKSLLYLVANAFEDEFKPFSWKWPGIPLLGMEKFVEKDADCQALFKNKSAEWILSPNNVQSVRKASRATTHGGFDDDDATVKGILARILHSNKVVQMSFAQSATGSENRRQMISQGVNS